MEILHTGLTAIAERLNVERRTVLRWIREEGLPAFKASDRPKASWRCVESSLCEWLKSFEKNHLGNGRGGSNH